MFSSTTTVAAAAAPLLLGAGLLYWQTMSKHKEKDNCTTNKEKISSTKSSERVSPEVEETFCCGPCNELGLDLSLLPCIRQRRSVFPNE